MLGNVQDITERKQAQIDREQQTEQIAQLLAAAEAANQSKDEFVSLVAHEFNLA